MTEGRRTLDALAAATPELRRLAAAAGPTIDALGPLARLLPDTTRTAAPLATETRRLVEHGPRADPRGSARSPARRSR